MCPSHKIGNWHELDGQNETSLLKGGHFGMMSISKNGLKKGPWTTAEDEILAAYVKKHGEGNWNSVQKNTRLLRCGKSCRLRWVNHLRPNLKKGAFTADEEKKIVELHAKMGNKWAKMAAQLPGRTDNEIKNYWNTRTKKLHRAGLPLYPPELCSQALAENQQPDVSGGRSTDDDKHDNFVQATNPSIPEIKFSGLISQEYLTCFPEVTNMHCGDMVIKGPACLQYPYVAPANHHTKRLQEFPLPSDGHNVSMGNGFAHAYQTQSSYLDPLAPPCLQHNFHVSSSELKPLHLELPSVQNPETHTVLCKKSCLSAPPLEPIYEVPSEAPIGNCQFKQEANSEKNGLLCSAHPVLAKNPRIATNLSSVVSSIPYGQSSSNKSRKGREVEISEGFSNPVSPLDSSISNEYDCISTPKTKRRCLTSDEDLAYKAIFGCPEAALVDQEYHEGEDDELSSWLDFSGLDPLIDLGWLCQGYCLG